MRPIAAIAVAIPVTLYVGLYPWLFPGREGYYEYGAWILAKIPHYWASFTMLTQIEPYHAPFGVPGIEIANAAVNAFEFLRPQLAWTVLAAVLVALVALRAIGRRRAAVARFVHGTAPHLWARTMASRSSAALA